MTIFHSLGVPAGSTKVNDYCTAVRKDSPGNRESVMYCPAGTNITGATIWPHSWGKTGHVTYAKKNGAVFSANHHYSAEIMCCK